MTREDIVNAMSLEDAIQVFRDTNCYGTMDIAKTVILNALEQEPVLDKIRAEIEQVKVIMNEEIIEHNRKDLINFINGINQCLVIIDKYRG